MRPLIEATFVSLDGVIESQEKWALPYFSRESKSEALVELASVDTFLLGRETYEKFAATWSRVKSDPYFDRVNSLRKLVASTKAPSASNLAAPKRMAAFTARQPTRSGRIEISCSCLPLKGGAREPQT